MTQLSALELFEKVLRGEIPIMRIPPQPGERLVGSIQGRFLPMLYTVLGLIHSENLCEKQKILEFTGIMTLMSAESLREFPDLDRSDNDQRATAVRYVDAEWVLVTINVALLSKTGPGWGVGGSDWNPTH